MNEAISDNRYELIKKYKQKLIEATNIESREDEMKVIDNILFRFWQIGWLDRLEGVCFDEWCDDCKEYDTKKKCCPRFNRVIRGAMNREPSEDGTLEVKVEDATKIGRVLIIDDKHSGGLYYPDEYEPKGDDLISRADAIEALGEEPLVWCDEEYEIAERSQWRDDIEAIKSVPSAGRPRGEWVYHEDYKLDGECCYECSECGRMYDYKMNYCGYCGADMRGEDE